jgi:predicted nucleotidyltransferase
MDQSTLNPEIITIAKKFAALVGKDFLIEKAIVFGSQAKGTSKEYSDIDICLVSQSFGINSFEERLMLTKKYANHVDDRIEPHPFSPQDLQNKYNTLATEIVNFGIVI